MTKHTFLKEFLIFTQPSMNFYFYRFVYQTRVPSFIMLVFLTSRRLFFTFYFQKNVGYAINK